MKFNLIKNKKGAEKLFTIWYFIVFGIVGLGIVAGVFLFYSADIDVRESGANLLYDKIANCLVEEGFLIENFLKADFDLISACDLNKQTFSKGSEYYSKVNFVSDFQNKTIEIGNSGFKKDCGFSLSENVKTEKFPKCLEKELKILYIRNNEFRKGVLEILVASNSKGVKVAV